MTSNEQLALPLNQVNDIAPPSTPPVEPPKLEVVENRLTPGNFVSLRAFTAFTTTSERTRIKRVRDAFVKRLARARAKLATPGEVKYVEHFTNNANEARHIADYLAHKGVGNSMTENGPNNFTIGVHVSAR